MSTTMTPAQLATAAEHLLAAKMFSLASCVMLFYDITITFGDEVERIWKQRFTGATVLWFLNRYLSPLGYIVIIVAFQDPGWPTAACQRYVLYPEILKIFTASAVGIIFILRLYSIYSKNRTILYGFTALLVLELAVKIWAFTDGVMLQLPPGFVGCILTGKSSPGDRLIYTWVAELVFDSAVFFATLYRTIQLYRRTVISEAQSLITVIMRDGIMYFAAIFVSNLVTVMIFVFATNDLKVINASFSTLITSLMVSRLMLNLRGEILRRGPVVSHSHHTPSALSGDGEMYHLSSTGYSKQPAPTESRWDVFDESIVGNLGAPIITFEAENRGEYDVYRDSEDSTDTRQPQRRLSLPTPSSYPQHSYPPSSPISPHTADLLRTYYDDHPRSEDPHDPTPKHSSPRIPVHANHTTHRIHSVPRRRPSGDSSASSFTVLPLPPPKHRQRAPTPTDAPWAKPQRPRPSLMRRPRSSESRAEREREAAQTRSLPAALVVQVTEEVVVAEEVGYGANGSTSPKRGGAGGPGGKAGRPAWLAPPSWRLSREIQDGRPGGAEG